MFVHLARLPGFFIVIFEGNRFFLFSASFSVLGYDQE